MSERLIALAGKIEEAYADRDLCRKLEQQLNSMSVEQREAEQEQERLLARWQEEQKDVQQLTSISLANLFYTLIGTKGQRLSKEQVEEIAAKERYELAASVAEALKQDAEQLKAKLTGVRFWETSLRYALQEKEELLRQIDPQITMELEQLQQEKVRLRHEKKELSEAHAAGQKALRVLRDAEDKFKSAKGWSTYDMLGGGMISTHMKHSRMDEAQRLVQQSNHALRTLHRELKDVEKLAANTELVSVSGGLKFADYFFDGLIADWMVNNKINASIGEVTKSSSQVRKIVSKLHTRLSQVEARLAEVTRKYDALILEY